MKVYKINIKGIEIDIIQNEDGTFNKPDIILKLEKQGTNLKPSHEPICMARKPLSEKTVAKNVLKWKTGGINIDASRVKAYDSNTTSRKPTELKKGVIGYLRNDLPKLGGNGYLLGRFPANLIHNNSEEVRDCFPESKSINNNRMVYRRSQSNSINSKGMNKVGKGVEYKGYDDQGNASRYFKSIIYQPKASKKDRGEDNHHPTVKPISLMEYLIKMVTPKGGLVLDPFAGSGSTLVAAKNLNYEYIGIELIQEYIPIINSRLNN